MSWFGWVNKGHCDITALDTVTMTVEILLLLAFGLAVFIFFTRRKS